MSLMGPPELGIPFRKFSSLTRDRPSFSLSVSKLHVLLRLQGHDQILPPPVYGSLNPSKIFNSRREPTVGCLFVRCCYSLT